MELLSPSAGHHAKTALLTHASPDDVTIVKDVEEECVRRTVKKPPSPNLAKGTGAAKHDAASKSVYHEMEKLKKLLKSEQATTAKQRIDLTALRKPPSTGAKKAGEA